MIETVGKHAVSYLDRRILEAELHQNFPNPAALDGWVKKEDFTGRQAYVRAYGPRLIHVLPGNSPGVAIKSIAQGALVKAVNLFKMSSADPFYTVAILRTMAAINPEHPIVKSMSAVYWRGGDAAVENVLYRPQYFDKIVAWGGGDAILPFRGSRAGRTRHHNPVRLHSLDHSCTGPTSSDTAIAVATHEMMADHSIRAAHFRGQRHRAAFE